MGEWNSILGNSAGPVPFPIKGTTYQLTRLSLGDKADYETWDESGALRACRRGLRELDAESYKVLLSATRDEIKAGAYRWGGSKWQESIRTDDGLAMLLWLSLRAHQPKLTIDDARRLREQALDDDAGTPDRHPEIIAILFDLAFEGKATLPPVKGTATVGA